MCNFEKKLLPTNYSHLKNGLYSLLRLSFRKGQKQKIVPDKHFVYKIDIATKLRTIHSKNKRNHSKVLKSFLKLNTVHPIIFSQRKNESQELL